MKLTNKETDVFGLDIGTTAIRCVQFKRDSQGSFNLHTYGEVPIDDSVSRTESEQDRKKVAESIQQLVKDARISTDHVVAGLPSDKVFSSIVSLPVVEDKELPQAVEYQVEQNIPMAVSEAKVDWRILRRDEQQQQTEVLLVATHKDNPEALLSLLESIGLDLVAVEPDALASTRSLVSRTNESPLAVVDVGAYAADIVVARGQDPWVIRNATVGGNTVIKTASQNLNVDLEQAGQFVRKFGMTKTKLEGQVYNAIKPTVDSLVDEVSKSIKFFNSRYSSDAIEKVVLTGGVVGWPDLPVYIADSLGLPVELGNSWINTMYPANQQDSLMQISNRFAVASGLAQRTSHDE